MSVGIDLGSSTVKVVYDEDPTVGLRRPVDAELTSRIGTVVPLVRRTGGGATAESPHDVYVRELAHVLNGVVSDGIVVVVPDWWSEHARSTVEQALHARVSVPVRLESTALAAVRAAVAEHDLPSTIAVLDIGAESSSAAVVTDVHGDPRLAGRPTVLNGRGGNELDRRLVQHVLDGLRSAGRGLNPTDPEAVQHGQSLLSDVRHAKERLSVRPSVSLATRLPDSEAELRIVRAEFDEVADGTVQALMSMVHGCVEHSTADERVGAVLLIGGGASIPLVSQRISTDLGLPVVLDDAPATLAVRGASMVQVAEPAKPRRSVFGRRASGPQHVVFALDEPYVIRIPVPVVAPTPAPVAPAPAPAASVVVPESVVEPVVATPAPEPTQRPTPVPPAQPVVERVALPPEEATPAPAPVIEPVVAPVAQPVATSASGRVFDVDSPLEILVVTDESNPSVARTTTRWLTALGEPGVGNPEGAVGAAGQVCLRIGTTVHPVYVGDEHTFQPVTIVMLGLHVLITKSSTGDLLREVRLAPEHEYRPE